jgi:hypothetical protein
MHIILRGPSYGADIVWDEDAQETGLVQGVWREQKGTRPPANRPHREKPRLQPIPDDAHQVMATNGLEARPFTRSGASPAKLCDLDNAAHVALLRRSPRRKDQDSNKTLVTSKHFPPDASFDCLAGPVVHQIPALHPKIPSTQTPAWQAGRLAAEIPSVLERMADEVEKAQLKVPQWLTQQEEGNQNPSDKRHQVSSSSNEKLAPTPRTGVWHPTARAELDAFVGAYHTRRLAAHSRVTKLITMRELQAKAKADQRERANEAMEGDEDDTERAAGGSAKKRRRCA